MMLDNLLNKIKVMFIITFLIGSVVFYYTLKDFHEEELKQQIQDDIYRIESMQQFVSQYQKPSIYKLIAENNISKDYFEPSLMSSTFIVSHINEIFEKNHLQGTNHSHEKFEFKFASDNPTNLKNKANAFESEILKKFNSSDISFYQEKIERNGKEVLFNAIPVRANTKACLRCHGDPKDAPEGMKKVYGDKNGFYEKEGDIRSINVIYSSVDSDGSMLKFYLSIETLMFIIFLSIYFTVRFFVLQLSEKDKLIVKQSKFAAMGEMISMIAHQWRQPLTGMRITTNNMILDIDLEDIDEKRFKENLEIVNKQIDYLSDTIDDFKNFFKPNVKPELVDINKLIDDSCMIIHTTIKNSGVELHKDYSLGVSVFTHKNDLTQIILNLVKNSMDAYVDGNIDTRVIYISTSENDKNVFIKVKDNAGGIPSEILEKIFDPYFSTKDKKNGTGLGLYMSKMIIESHLNGELDVYTENHSTIFTIRVPKVKEK